MKTITAISTPIGYGGIGIVRISGEEAMNIVNKIFKLNSNKSKLESHTIKLGKIYDNGEVIDEVLVSYFKAPNSYTGEDVVEINSHGGIFIVKKILDLLLKNGAYLAEPGEFTKRAFLNGKVDLSQAEAVMDLINSKTDRENRISVNQLEGNLGNKIRKVKADLIDLLVDIEAEIDYPEYDLEEVKKDKIQKVLTNNRTELERLLSTYDEGKLIKNGINTAIVGKPNVGKSSLLNNLINEERAIVTDIAGTTRDVIEESINLDGIILNIMDTAGIRETKDVVEEIGVEKSKKAIEKADLILFLVDVSENIEDEDIELYNTIKEKHHIVVFNKIDKVKENQINTDLFKNSNSIVISAKDNIGIDNLKDMIIKMYKLNDIDSSNEVILSNERHKNAIYMTIKSIENVLNMVNSDIPLDMISIDIQNGIKELSSILGEDVSEDVINGIFKKFCLGK